MTDKQMNIGQCPYEGECQQCRSACSTDVYCFIKQLFHERNEAEKQLNRAEQKLEKIKEHLATVSYLAPFSTRVLKHTINQIIEE